MSAEENAAFISEVIQKHVLISPANRMPDDTTYPYFMEPLVAFADGNDPLFTEYQSIIDKTHLTPKEAFSKKYSKAAGESHLSVISWILPINPQTSSSNRTETTEPSRNWALTRFYGEQFNNNLRKHVTASLTEKGYRAVAPMLESFFKIKIKRTRIFSNWSERHAAYAAGLGTFSLSDGFITERGIAHRCGSVLTDMPLPASPRLYENPFANCLYYSKGSCGVCITRCPTNAISEKGHDKDKCRIYYVKTLAPVRKKYDVKIAGCGLCQTGVPCEFVNPMKNA